MKKERNEDIYQEYKNGTKKIDLAKKYDLSLSRICQIVAKQIRIEKHRMRKEQENGN